MIPHYRPSLKRHNAPYRGVTSEKDVIDFNLGILHDVQFLMKISGGLEGFRGHSHKIKDNLSAIYHGEGEITATIPSAAKLTTKAEKLNYPFSGWVPVGTITNTTLTGTNRYQLTSSLHQTGMSKTIPVEPGQILVIRVHITASNTSARNFAIGALNVQGETSDLNLFSAIDFRGDKSHYIEKRIYVETKQDLEVVFYNVYGTEGQNQLTLKDFNVFLYRQLPTQLEGVDNTIKNQLAHSIQQLDIIEEWRESQWR